MESSGVYVNVHVIGASLSWAPARSFAMALTFTTSPVRTSAWLTCTSSDPTGLGPIVYGRSPFTPSTVAEMTTAPGLTAVTLPNRSTVATSVLELVQRTTGCGRIEPSACVALAACASVTPANSFPDSGVISTRANAGHVTLTGMVTESGAGPLAELRPVNTVATTL